jgi:hypothetical protein
MARPLRVVRAGGWYHVFTRRVTHIPHIAGRISAPVLAFGYEAAW